MNYTPEEAAQLLANRPNQPHYIASLIAECVTAERERCAKVCEQYAWLQEEGSPARSNFRNCAATMRAGA